MLILGLFFLFSKQAALLKAAPLTGTWSSGIVQQPEEKEILIWAVTSTASGAARPC